MRTKLELLHLIRQNVRGWLCASRVFNGATDFWLVDRLRAKSFLSTQHVEEMHQPVSQSDSGDWVQAGSAVPLAQVVQHWCSTV